MLNRGPPSLRSPSLGVPPPPTFADHFLVPRSSNLSSAASSWGTWVRAGGFGWQLQGAVQLGSRRAVQMGSSQGPGWGSGGGGVKNVEKMTPPFFWVENHESFGFFRF